MQVFMTGAAGCIGDSAADQLVRHGREVLGLARSVKAYTMPFPYTV